MAFKWLKRRRNTLAADTPPPSIPPPLPSPRHSHFATQQRSSSSVYPQPSSPSTASTPSEAPKIRRRKSFFQTIGLAKDKDKDKDKDKARKRASSFSVPPLRFDRDTAPPVPPLPNGAASTPPAKLDPAPRKRKSLVPRKAPPSAWAGDATPHGDARDTRPPPVPPVPVVPTKTNPPAKLPRTEPLGAVQLDDIRGGELPDSPPDLGAGRFTALDALDRLDAIGTLDLGSSLTQPATAQPSSRVPPSSFASPTVNKRNSLPALDKPLPFPGLAQPATSQHVALDPRAASSGMPEVDSPVLSPTGKTLLGAELPQPSKGSRRSVTSATFEPPKSASIRTASSSSADSPAAPTAQSSSYRNLPPTNVEMVPLPDVLNRPMAGRIAQATIVSAVSSSAPADAVKEATKSAEPTAKEPHTQPVAQPEPAVGSRAPELPPIMGGPAKIQAVFESAADEQLSESKPEPKSEFSPVQPAPEPQLPELAPPPAPVASRVPELPPIMGGPAKIQGVWESSYTYQEEKAKEEAGNDKQEGGVQAEDTKGEAAAKDGEEAAVDHGKEELTVDPKTAGAGESEEIADDASEVSDAQPISTDLVGFPHRASTSTWGASTEQLVDRPWSEVRVSVDAARPTSAFMDRPMSGHDAQLLGTPTRLPSTQTFGSLPGTSTFGALPRPTSISVLGEEDVARGQRLGAVAESETAQGSARASVPSDNVTPKPTPLPQTPPRLPAILAPSPGVPELYTPDATPPSQQIHTPAQHEPFKPSRSVSTPSKPQLSRSLTRPESPRMDKGLPRMPSTGNLRPGNGRSVTAPMASKDEADDDEPTLDHFMTLFRQVQKRGQGVGIRAAAAAAEGRELKERRPYGIGLGQPATS
ncbi:hypothetical protein CcaverHIS002_0309920 [Cutaneotrichosporon cavernicola]|nr:hypothetical protein CcaverHIS002_0309920 [Cutaneotrichosporon cavernicola]